MLYKLPEETLILQDTVKRFVDNELIPLEREFPERPNSYDFIDFCKDFIDCFKDLTDFCGVM